MTAIIPKKPKSEPDVYEFNGEIQDDILRLMIHDSDFAHASQHWVKPSYFSGEERKDVATLVLNYIENYQVPPRKHHAQHELYILYGKDIPLEVLGKYWDNKADGKEYTLDLVADFAQAQAWKSAIFESLGYLKKRQFDKVNQIMERAAKVRSAIDSGVYWYFETLDSRIDDRKNDDVQDDEIFPTGIPELDSVLRLGGIARGEMGLFIAPTNGGKSIALGNMAKRAIWENKRVLLVSMEMSSEKYSDRMDASFTGINMSDLMAKEDKLIDSMAKLRSRFARNLVIKRFPTKGATIADIEATVTSLKRTHNWEPDMIVLDYAAIMKPRQSRPERHLELQEILEDFRGLLVRYNCAGWTAAQTGKAGASAATVRGTHVAGSWDSLGICDYIITISLTDEERRNGELRLFVEKNRDGTAKVEIGPLLTDWARMAFTRIRVPY